MQRIRILSDIFIDGNRIASDSLADVPAELAAQLVASGNADDHPEAVAHCLAQGIVPVALGEEVPAQPVPQKPRKESAK